MQSRDSFIRFVFVSAVLLLIAAPVVAQTSGSKQRISKCQDANGKWHYGDSAAEACAKSKIEVLSGEGIKKNEIAAPPTEAELADRERRKDELDREKRSTEENAKRDKILLSTYGHEDDILLVRDRKLAQIEATVKASNDTVKSLRAALGRLETQKQDEEKKDAKAAAQTGKSIQETQAQIERHEGSIAQKRKEQEQMRKQYAEELERYRELKSKTAPQVKK